MPPGVGYPSRLSGTTGQDAQRLQAGGPQVPLAGASPLDLLGNGAPASPEVPQAPLAPPSLPQGITPQLPGVDE